MHAHTAWVIRSHQCVRRQHRDDAGTAADSDERAPHGIDHIEPALLSVGLPDWNLA